MSSAWHPDPLIFLLLCCFPNTWNTDLLHHVHLLFHLLSTTPEMHIPEARIVSTPSPFLNQMPSAKHCAEVGLPAQKTRSVLQDRSGQTQPALILNWQRTPTCW